MKQWVGWVLLALSLVVAYQGWVNVTKIAETEDLAKSVACEIGKDCALEATGASGYKSDVFSRHYQWQSTQGPVHVTCKREFVFLGKWGCTSQLGTLQGPS